MVESKQIKVDNWGIFFLQRLQQFYNKSTHCDLTLLFDDHIKIRVHRLVLNACTEYFQVLEKTCPIEDNCMRMPSNLPSDIVIPIINFMYSGILDLNEASYDRLYSTAKLMNMSVLTKLLDAQKTPIKPVLPQKRLHAAPIAWHTPLKKIVKPTSFVDDLPETLPGRKLPIWRRKSFPTTPYIGQLSSSYESNYTPIKKFVTDEPPKPTRFDWPENDNENNFDNAFDDISYESKPLILPPFQVKEEKSPKPGPSSTFEEIKKTAAPVKRSASPIGNQPKKVNLQDVKEYLKEHKIRSDYIDYEEEEGPDNDLQTFDNEEDSAEDTSQNVEDAPNKSILKNEGATTPPTNKHVRFSLESEEDKKTQNKHVRFSLETEEDKKTVKVLPKGAVIASKSDQDMSKHTKIIAEVLKKYPHLVKNNKNIRLKILAKGNGTPTKTIPTKNVGNTKMSYMVMKPEENKKGPTKEEQVCTKCDKPQKFASYHLYRQHLTDVHNEKPDSQTCMFCGYFSKKQNILAYHKFVKHNIPPPAMYIFPKCKECSYIALSPIALQKHMATHPEPKSETQFSCKQCDKKFVSETILKTHMDRNHKEEIKVEEKPVVKDKIKILSDVKVINQNQGYQSNKEVVIKAEVPTEPSSEAEALSNVASGIAASLGLVDTIVVLDENQFILQSQAGNIQQNIINSDGQEYIIPDMQIGSTVSNEDQPVGNNVLAQTIKTGITSTDELVMVLTDHDYGDGNNAVITDNNIVVLYSHPVQTQAGTMMLTSEGNMIEVDKNYAQNIPVTIAGNCEESIEMIQQEINNQLDTPQEVSLQVSEASQMQNTPVIHVQSNIQVNPLQEIITEKMEPIEEQNYGEEQSGHGQQMEPVEENVQEMEMLEQNVGQSETNVGLMEQNVGYVEQNEGLVEQNVGLVEQNVGLVEEEQRIEQNVEQVGQNEENMIQIVDRSGQVVYVTQGEENVSQIVEESMDTEHPIPQTHEESTVGLIEENVDNPHEESMIQYEENVKMEESSQMQETLEQVDNNMDQIDPNEIKMEQNISQVEEEPQSQEFIDQNQGDENIIQDPQIQDNIQEDAMEVDQNVCQEAPEGLIEENIVQTQEEVLQTEPMIEEQENMSQFVESSQIEEGPQVPVIEEAMEINQQVHEENEATLDPNMIQNEEEPHDTLPPTEEMDQEPQIEDQVEENLVENEEIVQREENVPYDEERLPIDASIEQIGDIPQNEENGSSNDKQNEVQTEVTIDTNIQNEAEVTQIDPIQTETDVNEELKKEIITESNEDIEERIEDRNEMVVEEVRTSSIEIKNENVDIEIRKSEKIGDNTKEAIPIQGKHDRISKILDDWDDGESDSQQSSKSQQIGEEEKIESSESIKKLIDDWEEEEDT